MHRLLDENFCLHLPTDYCLHFPPDMPLNDGLVSIHENNFITFEGCFVNPFVYEFSADIVNNFPNEKARIAKKYLDEIPITGRLDKAAMDRALEKYRNADEQQYWRLLHKFIDINLAVGEFVELYSVDLTGLSGCFGSPKATCSMNLCDILTPFDFQSDEDCKLILYKTDCN